MKKVAEILIAFLLSSVSISSASSMSSVATFTPAMVELMEVEELSISHTLYEFHSYEDRDISSQHCQGNAQGQQCSQSSSYVLPAMPSYNLVLVEDLNLRSLLDFYSDAQLEMPFKPPK
jgi:hypothetical protein